MDLKELDNLFRIYGYEVREENENNRAYLLRQGMYYGAEIFSTDGSADTISKKYKESDYACKIENFSDINEAENYLFNGFFQTNFTKHKIKDKYKEFAESQVKQYKDPSIKYVYIDVPYHYYGSDELTEKKLIDEVCKYIEKDGAYLIIIEAAAGFGKTSTAFELYKSMEKYCDSRRPLFTELTRNRTQKLFKYVLRDEVENEYNYGINTDLVVYNIKKGKIPFIIDGFDELLTKNIDHGTPKEESEFNEVESMLSTIGDLLTENAKIVLTSRKTAIFAGEEFNNWVEQYKEAFQVVRFQIEKPQIKDWLPEERLAILQEQNIPIDYISNPVLLTYLKNIKDEKFIDIIADPDSITDKYFRFLLDRENERQKIQIAIEDQLSIYRNLAKEFYNSGFNCDERPLIKFLIDESNKELLLKYKENSPQTEEELLNSLTNHALLDRLALIKNKEYIGFINDFVFGYLLGDALLKENASFLREIYGEQLEKVFGAYKFCGASKRNELWKLLLEYKSFFPQRTKISFDINLTNTLNGDYIDDALNSYEFSGISFLSDKVLVQNVTFTDTLFENCRFDKRVFKNVYFTGCTFHDCSIIPESENCQDCQIQCYGCEDFDSNFVNHFNTIALKNQEIDSIGVSVDDIEKKLLARYFKVDKRSLKMKLISSIENEFKEYNVTLVFKKFHQLKKQGFIKQDGNNSHLTSLGATYYHKTYGND